MEHFTITAELRFITPHVYMWVETGSQVSQEELEESALRFETHTYPTNRQFFGTEWTPGVDNDVHLSVLNAHNLGWSIGGYFSSADEYSRLANPYSNEREMFYINLDGRKPGDEEYDATLAHEFQHMIHWYNDRNEDTWLNEGLAMLAEQLNGFDTGGVEYAYLATPDTQLTSWPDGPEDASANYGASYLFSAYFLDRFGAELTRAMIARDENGQLGIDQALANAGLNLSFDDIFADWLVANYLDNPDLENGRWGYRDLALSSVALDHIEDSYPVRRTSTVHQYAADYVELIGHGDLIIEFSGSTVARLADNEAHSGRFTWWSRRGDDTDCTLTRALDLSTVTSATLEFWTWYDIEEEWDYAYVEVSTDQGQSWKILSGDYTTDSNPHGNAFGPGYTGLSGGGQTPRWVKEQIDLSAYAGREILLRFEYVTDDAVNHPGFFLDDIRVPEIGFYDDVENSAADGWEAAGFIRTDNIVPQNYLVQLIELGDQVRVRRMTLDSNQHGQMELIGLGDKVDRAILVISALAPATTEIASYEYRIIPKADSQGVFWCKPCIGGQKRIPF